MKTAEIFFVNGSGMRVLYDDIQVAGEWLHFKAGNEAHLSASSRAVLYIEHDVDEDA